MSDLPMLEDALRDAAARRLRRRRPPRRFVVPAATVVATAALVLVLVLVRPGPEHERPAVPAPVTWTPIAVGEGLVLSLPPGWDVARETLTPHLTDPVERFSAGTFGLSFSQGACNHQPDGALRDMRSTDAFVTLQERRAGGRAGFAVRPERFERALRFSRGDCLAAREDLSVSFYSFTDMGRDFHAFVVVGRDASAAVRAETFEVLDRLRVEPRG